MNYISLTALRTQLFKIADQVIQTGIPIEIDRNGHILKLVLDKKKSKLANLKKRDCINGNPDELINIEASEWNMGTDL